MVVAGGSALLPDLDHPRATAAKSLGLLTGLLAIAVDRAAIAIYHATRTPGDSSTRQSGHRLASHTIPWSLLTGVLAGLLCLLGPVTGAVACGLLGGLLALGLRQAGLPLAGVTGWVAWWVLTEHPGWWPVVPVAVTVGCLLHIVGDAMTESGVPVAWPVSLGGERWRMVTFPVTFSAGDQVETLLVAPGLLVALAVAVSSVTGVLPVLVSAAVTALG